MHLLAREQCYTSGSHYLANHIDVGPEEVLQYLNRMYTDRMMHSCIIVVLWNCCLVLASGSRRHIAALGHDK
jgi:hypothetical protein